MLLLILFALIAGAGTALSPCVLPVLPAVLSAGVTGGRRRPLGVATGLALSFTFATVALVYVIGALGLPDDFARTLAIVVLAVFGVLLLVPPLSDRVEAYASRLVSGPEGFRGDGFWAGMLLGFSLGFVYAPCAGPILAGVITVSASQDFTADKLLVAFAYGIGSAAVIYAILLGGRRVTDHLGSLRGRVNYVMGAVMIAVAVLLATNVDTRFETALARTPTVHVPLVGTFTIPDFVVTPTKSLEDSSSVQDNIAELHSGHVQKAAGQTQANTGKKLPVLAKAPNFTQTQRWFNTPGDRPLSIPGLRGKVVLLDFWTYTCINCLRTLPYVEAWYRKYQRDGLVVVGVHTPEFPFEKDAGNVENAIGSNDLTYPVVQDNEYGTWTAYRNQYWPAKYLIDAQGRVRYVHFGEGEYPTTEKAIRSLLAERGAKLGGETRVNAQKPSAGLRTPESYLGVGRAQNFAFGPVSGEHDYKAPASLQPNELAYGGRWNVTPESATAVSDSTLSLSFDARRVFLVLGSPQGPKPLQVLLDGKPVPDKFAGADVHGGTAKIDEQRLYSLVNLPKVEVHTLTLRFAPGISGYAFTFG